MQDATDNVLATTKGMFTPLDPIQAVDPFATDLDMPRVNQQGLLPRSITDRLLASNPGKPVAVLVGNDFSYQAPTPNSTFSFNHGLSYVPTVIASMSYIPIASDTVPVSPLPYMLYTDNTSYFGNPPSATVTIDSISSTSITVRFVATDGTGISTLLATRIYFQFLCFNYGTD